MNVKINDNVLVIAGKDKGKQGKILATSPKANTVVVEGVRIQKKHEKARKANETSKIVSEPGPIDASNVMVVCPTCGKATRVKHAVVDGKKVRVCGARKADGTVCGAVLDKAYAGKAKAAPAAAEQAPKKRVRKRAAKAAAETTETENK
ncbi:MAG TPA: 50S ribosomal protein L24 [Candidatus Scatosoma pullicola]|nr:50S ribosomal protein L24 [Candidatus Scatosoma pullicola]